MQWRMEIEQIKKQSKWQLTNWQLINWQLVQDVQNGTHVGCVGHTKILKHAQFLCQFYELSKLNTHTGVKGCGFVAWFGKYTEIAFLVSLSFWFYHPSL